MIIKRIINYFQILHIYNEIEKFYSIESTKIITSENYVIEETILFLMT